MYPVSIGKPISKTSEINQHNAFNTGAALESNLEAFDTAESCLVPLDRFRDLRMYLTSPAAALQTVISLPIQTKLVLSLKHCVKSYMLRASTA